MEQRRLVISLAVWLIAGFLMSLTAQIPVPLSVKQFYGGMEEMATGLPAGLAGELTTKMTECFVGNDNSGINVPNDFKHIEIDAHKASHNNVTLTSNNYVDKLYEYVYENRKLTPNVKISSYSRKSGMLPTFDKKRMSAEDAFIETIVNKTFSYLSNGDLVVKEFTDTVYTHIIQNKICAIVNGMENFEDNDLDILRVKAAQAYQAKRYEDAYLLFKRIAELDLNDAEPYYRLALMTYYGKGCRRNKKYGIELMRKSSYRRGSFSDKADNVLLNWTYENTL